MDVRSGPSPAVPVENTRGPAREFVLQASGGLAPRGPRAPCVPLNAAAAGSCVAWRCPGSAWRFPGEARPPRLLLCGMICQHHGGSLWGLCTSFSTPEGSGVGWEMKRSAGAIRGHLKAGPSRVRAHLLPRCGGAAVGGRGGGALGLGPALPRPAAGSRARLPSLWASVSSLVTRTHAHIPKGVRVPVRDVIGLGTVPFCPRGLGNTP